MDSILAGASPGNDHHFADFYILNFDAGRTLLSFNLWSYPISQGVTCLHPGRNPSARLPAVSLDANKHNVPLLRNRCRLLEVVPVNGAHHRTRSGSSITINQPPLWKTLTCPPPVQLSNKAFSRMVLSIYMPRQTRLVRILCCNTHASIIS